jgi:hypothetical protein
LSINHSWQFLHLCSNILNFQTMLHHDLISRTSYCLILLVIIIVFGFVIHKTGRPFNTLLFTIHKLAALALIVYGIFSNMKVYKYNTIGGFAGIILLLITISLVALFISGAILSIQKQSGKIILYCHILFTFLSVICYGIFLFLLSVQKYD